MRKLLLVLAALVAAVVVWMWFGRSGDHAAGQGKIGRDDPLAFAPADTPYAFGNLAPLPADLASRWMSQADPQIPLWRKHIALLLELAEHDAADADADSTDDAQASEQDEAAADITPVIAREMTGWLRALDAELAQASTGTALAARFGLDGSSLSAIYGLGIVPVARMTLADPAAFRAAVARLETNSGNTLATLQLEGIDAGWRFPIPETPIQSVIALQGNHLIVTLAPLDDAAALRQLLGIERPARSLADSGELQRLNKAEGFSSYGSGYIDTARLLAVFRTPATALETAFLSQFDIEKPTLPAECEADVNLIIASFPRIISGYTHLDAARVEAMGRIEFSPAIAQDLMTLNAPTPGLAASKDAQATLSFAFKAAALPTLANKYAAAATKAPWTCPALTDLNEATREARESLNNPAVYAAGPMASSLLLALNHFAVDLAEEKLEDISGQVVIGSENAAGLIAMARNFVPQLESLNLVPGAAPQKLELEELVEVTTQPVFVAMEATALGIGIGDDQAKRLPTYLKADTNRQPVFHMAYSGSFIVQIAKLMRDAAKDMPEEVRESTQLNADIMEASYAKHIEHAEIDVLFTERGLEFRQRVRMKR